MMLREQRSSLVDDSTTHETQRVRVAIYCRVSTNEQQSRGTIQAQRKTLAEHAKRAGYLVVDTFCDDGKSAGTGKLEKRDAFHRMLKVAAAGLIDAVLVVALDRLTRTEDLIERASILGPLQRAGVVVLTPSERLDLRTSSGDLKAGIDASYAAMERAKILERTQGGKARLLSSGGKPHGMPPYGLRYDREAGWSIDRDEHKIIIQIFERVGAGESCTKIALDLEAKNVPPPGRAWQQTSVWTIVREARKRYAGRWLCNKVRGIWIDVPRLVSDAAIAKADGVLAASGGGRGNLCKRTVNVYLLDNNFARCATCGGMIGIMGHGRGKRRFYACRSRRKAMGYKRSCGAERHVVADVDAALWDALGAELDRSNVLDQAARELGKRDVKSDQAAAAAALAAARKRVANAAARVDVLLETSSDVDPDKLKAALARATTEQKEAALALRAAETAAHAAGSPDATPADLKAALTLLRREIAEATPAVRREIVRSVLVDVVISDEEITADVGIRVGSGSACPGLRDCSTSESRIRLGSIRVRLGGTVAA